MPPEVSRLVYIIVKYQLKCLFSRETLKVYTVSTYKKISIQ